MKEVAMTTQVKILFTGAFDNCHIGCDSCDFVTTTHTVYKDGTTHGLELKLRRKDGRGGVMREYFLEDPLHPKGGITVKCKDDHDPEGWYQF